MWEVVNISNRWKSGTYDRKVQSSNPGLVGCAYYPDFKLNNSAVPCSVGFVTNRV